MSTQYEGVKHIVYLDTNTSMKCEHCSERVGGEDFADSVNHYIEQHGYKLLHIGSETINDSDGGPWHTTAAVVGK